MKEVLSDTLDRIMEAQGYHQRAPEYGERAWRVRGRFADLVYWDLGNSWCDVIAVLPRDGCEGWLATFFESVEATQDE